MSTNQEQQILALNTQIKAELGVSKIDGVGVIAVTDIKEREKIYADKLPSVYTLSYGNFSKLFLYVREIILKRWPSVVNGSKFIYPDARLVSFMNHGKANYDPKTDTALRDIKKGEELLEDYTLMPNWEKVWPPEKNKWIILATSATASQSKKNINVALRVKSLIRNFVPSWMHAPSRK